MSDDGRDAHGMNRQNAVALGKNRAIGEAISIPDVIGEKAGEQREQDRDGAEEGRHDAHERAVRGPSSC